MLPIPSKSFARSCGLRFSSIVYDVSHEDTNRITEKWINCGYLSVNVICSLKVLIEDTINWRRDRH